MINNGKSGINRKGLKESNLMQIVRLLHFHNKCTRTSLAQEMGLTPAAITKLINELLEIGLVSESSSIESSIGRHPITLKLNNEQFLMLSGRINRDYISVGLYDLGGKCYEYMHKHITPAISAYEATRQLISLMKKCIKNTSDRIIGIGLALPGPFDAKNGRIALMSGFSGWNEIDLSHELTYALKLPVFLEHDANCGALAELWFGDYRNVQNMIYVVGDRGVGAGIILNGEIYHGFAGFAGELGHMSINCFGPRCECGSRGCLELYGSTYALEEEYQRLLFESWCDGEGQSKTGRINAQDICRMVREDDSLAVCAYEKIISYLAFGTVGIINTLNPEAVIYSDKITEGGPRFLNVVNKTLKQYLIPDVYNNLILNVSSLQSSPKVRDPMLLGAAILVFERLMKSSPADILTKSTRNRDGD